MPKVTTVLTVPTARCQGQKNIDKLERSRQRERSRHTDREREIETEREREREREGAADQLTSVGWDPSPRISSVAEVTD